MGKALLWNLASKSDTHLRYDLTRLSALNQTPIAPNPGKT
jgi:hypothetical protein